MGPVRAALAVGVLATLQVAFGGAVALFGVSPDLLACFAVFAALYCRPEAGIAWAWGAGLTSDVFFGFKLGPFAIVYAVCAYVLGGMRSEYMRGSHLTHLVATFGCTLASHLGYWLMHTVFKLTFEGGVGRVEAGRALNTALGVAVYSAAVAPVLFELFTLTLGRGVRSSDIAADLAAGLRQRGGA